MHIVVMSIIGFYDGFYLSQINLLDCVTHLQQAIDDTHPFKIYFASLTAFDLCLMIPGFPENDQLNTRRENLCTIFTQSNLEPPINAQYSLSTAHGTVVRFRQSLLNPVEYVVVNLRNKHLSEFYVKHAEFVFNDWYQRVEKTKVLADFKIGRQLSGKLVPWLNC